MFNLMFNTPYVQRIACISTLCRRHPFLLFRPRLPLPPAHWCVRRRLYAMFPDGGIVVARYDATAQCCPRCRCCRWCIQFTHRTTSGRGCPRRQCRSTGHHRVLLSLARFAAAKPVPEVCLRSEWWNKSYVSASLLMCLMTSLEMR